MNLKPETTGFVRGGMLFLEHPARWRSWQRDVWSCCPVPRTRGFPMLILLPAMVAAFEKLGLVEGRDFVIAPDTIPTE